MPPHAPQRGAQVLDESVEPGGAPGLVAPFESGGHAAEPPTGCGPRLIGGEALADQLVGLEIEVRLHLAFEVLTVAAGGSG